MRSALSVLVLVLVLCPAAVSAWPFADTTFALVDTTFDVDVTNPNWQPTGIMIEAGDWLYTAGFVAAYWNSGHHWENVAAEAWQEGNAAASPAPGLGYGMVCKIGDLIKGIPQMLSFQAPYSGELQVAYNDITHGDNAGNAICAVIVTSDHIHATGTDDAPVRRLPLGISLSSRPNPTPHVAEIEFDLSNGGHAKLLVVDESGRVQAVLLDGQVPAGRNRCRWNGKTDLGVPVPSGTYFYVLSRDGQTVTREQVVIR